MNLIKSVNDGNYIYDKIGEGVFCLREYDAENNLVSMVTMNCYKGNSSFVIYGNDFTLRLGSALYDKIANFVSSGLEFENSLFGQWQNNLTIGWQDSGVVFSIKEKDPKKPIFKTDYYNSKKQGLLNIFDEYIETITQHDLETDFEESKRNMYLKALEERLKNQFLPEEVRARVEEEINYAHEMMGHQKQLLKEVS